MFVAEVLEMAFSGLVADGAIEGMVDEQEFDDPVAGIDYLIAGDVLYHHPVHYIGTATSHEFGHGSGIV